MVNHLKLLIKSNFRAFISIMLLTMLGVSFFVGMKSTVPYLKYTVSKYYDKYHVFDLELTSSIGFTDEDIESFHKIQDIQSIEGVYSKDFVIKGKKDDYVLRIHSFLSDDTINRLELLEGSFPNNNDEIVIEKSLFNSQNYKIGDRILLESDLLEIKDLKIVGIVKSPIYLSSNKGSTSLLSGRVNYYAYVNTHNVHSDLYSSLYISVVDKNKVNSVIDNIKAVGKDVLETRYEKLIAEYSEKIEKGQAEIDLKREEYVRKIAEYEEQIANAELQIESADESIPSVEEARNILANRQEELSKVKAELDSAKAKIDKARYEYNIAMEEYNNYVYLASQFENSADPAEQLLYGFYQTSLYYAKSTLDNSKAELDGKELEYNLAYAEYQRVENTLNASSPEELVDIAKNEISHQKELLNGKKQELEESKKRTDEEFITYQNQLNDAKDYLKLISVNGWTINKQEDILSYKQYLSDIVRIEKISNFFPVIFYVVTVLITLTNISRIVTRDREMIGLYKALGYTNRSITKDYIMFSFLSCVIGSFIGSIIGLYLIPKIFYNVYCLIYYLPKYQFIIQYQTITVAISLAILLVVVSSYFSVRKTIREWPTSLLRPKIDDKGKRIFIEKLSIWKSLNFTNKVTFRNLFKYPKRFIMTILGISGCISLIIAGFNIRSSISNIIPLQFEHIFDIDAEVFFKDSISRNVILDEKKRIMENDDVDSSILSYVKYATFEDSDSRVNLVIPEDNDLLLDFVLLENQKKYYELTDDGAIITKKIAQSFNIKVGDVIHLKDSENNTFDVNISAIVDNYVDNYLYLTKQYYKTIVGVDPKYNTILVRMKNDSYNEEQLSNFFNENNNVSYLIYISSSKVLYENLSKSLNYIVYVLVFSAVLLAFVVLYNLNTLNVEERKREIATIRVLGFFRKETYQYIENEIKRLTVIGIIIGIFFGYIFSNILIKSCELDNLMYDYSIHYWNYVFAVIITVFFMIITSFLGRKNIKNINMIESLKKVE